jgi:hypothetical protein
MLRTDVSEERLIRPRVQRISDVGSTLAVTSRLHGIISQKAAFFKAVPVLRLAFS